MPQVLTKFLIVAAIMAVFDYIWLSKVATKFYLSELGDLAIVENGSFKPILWAAVVVYVCLAVGVTVFCLPLATSFLTALGYGALFGMAVYGVYDMTNYALVKNWPLKMSIVDILWGTFLCGITNALSFFVISKLEINS